MKGYCLPPQAEQCPEFMNFFTVWCESGAWARHYHQEKVDNFPLPPHSFSYCWLYCSDMSYDLTPSAAKGVTKYWLQCSHKKCLSKRKTERKKESRKKEKIIANVKTHHYHKQMDRQGKIFACIPNGMQLINLHHFYIQSTVLKAVHLGIKDSSSHMFLNFFISGSSDQGQIATKCSMTHGKWIMFSFQGLIYALHHY